MLPSEVVNQLQQVLPDAIVGHAGGWPAQNTIAFPVGYRWEFGGEKFEQDKGFRSLAIALVVSFAAIYLALVVQFNSVTQPLLVYAAVPFGVVGGLLGLAVMGSSFGFMAFLGVASLAGLIISHVIVLFDFIEEMKHKGEPLRQAVVDAGLARLRPVLTTVLATRRRPDPAGDGRRPAVGADVLRPDRRDARRHAGDAGHRAGAVRDLRRGPAPGAVGDGVDRADAAAARARHRGSRI